MKPPKKKTDRRKKARCGGQKGHQRNLREPLPPERVNETITYEMNAGGVRELGLTPTDDFEIIQHIELLDLPIHVTEHRSALESAASLDVLVAKQWHFVSSCPYSQDREYDYDYE